MYCSKLGPTERHDQHHHRRPRSNSSPCFRNFKLKLKFFYLLCLRTLCDLKGFINQGWEMIDSSRGHGTEQGWNWDSQTLMREWCWWEALGVWPVRRAGWAVLCHAPGNQTDPGNGVCWTRDAATCLGAQGWPFWSFSLVQCLLRSWDNYFVLIL